MLAHCLSSHGILHHALTVCEEMGKCLKPVLAPGCASVASTISRYCCTPPRAYALVSMISCSPASDIQPVTPTCSLSHTAALTPLRSAMWMSFRMMSLPASAHLGSLSGCCQRLASMAMVSPAAKWPSAASPMIVAAVRLWGMTCTAMTSRAALGCTHSFWMPSVVVRKVSVHTPPSPAPRLTSAGTHGAFSGSLAARWMDSGLRPATSSGAFRLSRSGMTSGASHATRLRSAVMSMRPTSGFTAKRCSLSLAMFSG